MRAVIAGCGRIGANLAETLSREGWDVAVLDTTTQAFRRVAADFRGEMILGTGIDEDVLRRAGIERADAFFAATDDDNTNIMAGQMAKLLFNVREVVVRLNDPRREEQFGRFHLDIVSPTGLAVAEMLEKVRSLKPEGS